MEDCSPLDDYALMSVIGKGSYAKVILVRKKSNSQLYAIKSMKKKYIEKKGQAKRIMMERDILTSITHPFLIKIYASFQDDKKTVPGAGILPGGGTLRPAFQEEETP